MQKFIVVRQNSTPKYLVKVGSHIIWSEEITKARRFPTERKAKDFISKFRLFRVAILPYELREEKSDG